MIFAYYRLNDIFDISFPIVIHSIVKILLRLFRIHNFSFSTNNPWKWLMRFIVNNEKKKKNSEQEMQKGNKKTSSTTLVKDFSTGSEKSTRECDRIDGARGLSRFFLSSCITGDDVARHCNVSRFPRWIHFLNHQR